MIYVLHSWSMKKRCTCNQGTRLQRNTHNCYAMEHTCSSDHDGESSHRASTAGIDHWVVTLTLLTSSAAARAAAEARVAAAMAARAFSSTSDEPGPAQDDLSAAGGWCSWQATLLLVAAYALELTAGDFGDSGVLFLLVSLTGRIDGLSLEMEEAGELSIVGVWPWRTDDPESSCRQAHNKWSEFLVFRMSQL